MNIKNTIKGLLVFAFLVGVVIASPASAQNQNANANAFINAHASLKADSLIKMESSVGVVLGPNNTLRVMGAKVTSVSGSDVSVTAPFGNSSLNFVVKTDAETKLNGKLLSSSSVLSQLKAGDKISFAGTITSSTSSSIVVDGDHVVSRVLYNDGRVEDKNSFKGEIKAVNESDSSITVKLKNGQTVKVNISSSTAITLDGAVSTLASLNEGDEVQITGELNSTGSIITASKISAESDDDNDNDSDDEDDDKDDNEDKGNRKENKGGFWGKIMNWFWK
ncbi:MAG TPA: DUF5666 domain-containing protein [Candidatus Paceibacterota bacterium]